MVWFNDQQHDRAIQAYEWLQQTDERQAESVFRQLVAELNQRIDIADTGFTDLALTQWLQSYPYNTELQLAFAKLCEQQMRFEDASNAYFDLADGAVTDAEQRRFLTLARELADQYLNTLSDNQRWDLAIEFIDQLIWREPDHIPHIIKLAKAYIANHQNDQARINTDTKTLSLARK
jgi:hypothetical protein